jgi:glycerol kinase
MAVGVMAVDQGTTSTRAIIFDHSGLPIASEQIEHRQIFPAPGWVEHDPAEIWNNTRNVMGAALAKSDLGLSDIAAVGITQQRETTLVWDRVSGNPVYNALVWQDTRTKDICDQLADGDPRRYAAKTGLPLATYFSGPKIRWILDNVPGVRHRAEAGDLMCGTMDTWLLYAMTGGRVHVTDQTNASRTLLMDLATGQWDPEMCEVLQIPMAMLPEIRSSSEVYAKITSPRSMAGVPIAGILGDQQAASFGQACLEPGMAKNTYGTGNFVLINTGTEAVRSENGLLTTVLFKLGEQDTVYALEGSIAMTGSLVQWLRDNMGLVADADDIETLAGTVRDNGDCYFVPAFSGLFAPYWRADARGAIVGLSRFINGGHIARAALESAAYQSREVIEAMAADSGVALTALKVDGGMVRNDLLMQFQADMLGVPVVRPKVTETTALGAAYAAGLAVGFWDSVDDIRDNWAEDKRWMPQMDPQRREALYARWKQAVQRTLGWVEGDA